MQPFWSIRHNVHRVHTGTTVTHAEAAEKLLVEGSALVESGPEQAECVHETCNKFLFKFRQGNRRFNPRFQHLRERLRGLRSHAAGNISPERHYTPKRLYSYA